MSNMGYCRFQNTVEDLRDCLEEWDNVNSKDKIKARKYLLELCKELIEEYGDDE